MRLASFGLCALFVILAAGAGSACSDDPPGEVVTIRSADATVRVAFDPFVVTVLDAKGTEVLRTLGGGRADAYGSPSATRDDGQDGVKGIPGWDAYTPEERAWRHARAAKLVAQTDTSVDAELDVGAARMHVAVKLEGAKVTLHTDATPKAGLAPADVPNKSTIAFALPEDEHFFGLGERFATLDHRGHSLYSWAEEGGTGSGENAPASSTNPFPNGPSMTYFPVPFFLSSRGYGMHLATTYRTETHFGSERPDAFRIAANALTLDAVVYVHADPLASLDDYTRDTGRPMIPATWVFGPRRRVSRQYMVDGIPEYQWLRQKKIPTTGIDDAVHFLPAKSQLGVEEELRTWVGNGHAWGYKMMAYNNPYVATSTASIADDFAYGRDNGLFATKEDGSIAEVFFISGTTLNVATIDLTKPAGVTWFQDLLRRTLAVGYDGWMHDFGEYVGRSWKFGDGRRGDEVHNQFPVLSAKAAHDLMEAERPGDYLFFVRSGYAGTQQYVPAVWGGDAEATFDETQGLPSAIRSGLNLGMSGVPYWGSDVTGFKCLTDAPRDKEIFIRWVEVGAVSPIMMHQDACSNPLSKQEKWKLWNDEETIQAYASMARLHTRLAPYFEVLAREAHEKGTPIMRHPFLLHPNEPEVWKNDSSFYLGPSLWAAPVVRRGEVVKDTWLPPGAWVELEDHTVHQGGAHALIPAPLGKLPLLLKDGGIVPMLDPSVDTLAPATEPSVVTADSVKDRLDVVVALSKGKEAKITLADGTELVARRAAESAVGPSTLPSVPAEQLTTCTDGCVTTGNEGGVLRLRLTTPLAPTYDVTHEDVTLSARGPLARRVRWDVLRLP